MPLETTPVLVPNEGMKLSTATSSAGAYTLLGGIIAVTPPAPEVAAVKSTLLAGNRQQYRPGKLPEPGKSKFTVQFSPSHQAHLDLEAAQLAGTTLWWKIEYNDSHVTHAHTIFPGFITTIDPNDAQDESNHEKSFEVQLTDFPVTTPGADA